MSLDEVRLEIDKLDVKLHDLFIKRFNLSKKAAQAKFQLGTPNVYYAKRETNILNKHRVSVPEKVRLPYMALMKKVLQTSRMYQYQLLLDWQNKCDTYLSSSITKEAECSLKVKIFLSIKDKNCTLASALSIIEDYGYEIDEVSSLGSNSTGSKSFKIIACGNIKNVTMQKLLFHLSQEYENFTWVPLKT